MSSNQKETKNNKNKRSASSFFSNLNTDSSIEYGYAEKNPKSKWAKWIIGGAILAATTVGIAVPWSLSSCTASLNRPFASSEIIYKYVDPITKKEVNVTYKEFEERINSIKTNVTIFEKWDDIFYETVLEDLYNEEREAYLKFKAIYYRIHNANPDISKFGENLDQTFSDIKSEQRKILENNKKTFQQAFGSSGQNWLNNWLKELQSNSIYGPQSTENSTVSSIPSLEEKAIAYMVTQKIKNSSLARYLGASISSNSWNFTDLQFALGNLQLENNSPIKYTSNDGTQKEITIADAITIWKSYLTPNENVVQPKEMNSTNNNQIAVFETKSYSTSFRNPFTQTTSNIAPFATTDNHLITLLNKYFNLGLISSFSISGITPGESNASAFKITSEALTSLFKVQIVNSNQTFANFAPISRLTSFKGSNIINTSNDPNNTNALDNQKDNLLVKTFETENNILGSSKILDLSSLIYKDSNLDMFGVAAITSSDAGITDINSTNDNSLFSIYKSTTTSGTNSKSDPISVFMKLLLTIASSTTNEIVFNGYTYAETNWNSLNYGTKVASGQLKTLVNLIKLHFDENTYEFKNTINPNDFNTQLTNAIAALGTNDFTFLGQLLNCILIGDTTNIKSNYLNNSLFQNQVGYWTLYELSAPDTQNNQPGTYLYVSTDGLKIFTKKVNNFSSNDFKNMAISDLNNTINKTGDSEASIYYDVASVFNKLNESNLIILDLLSNNQNVTKFKETIKQELTKNNNQDGTNIETESEKIYNEFYKYVDLKWNLSSNETITKIQVSIPTSISTIIESKRTYDFATLNDSSNNENIAIFQTLTKYNTSAVIKTIDSISGTFILKLTNLIRSNPNKIIKNDLKGGK